MVTWSMGDTQRKEFHPGLDPSGITAGGFWLWLRLIYTATWQPVTPGLGGIWAEVLRALIEIFAPKPTVRIIEILQWLLQVALKLYKSYSFGDTTNTDKKGLEIWLGYYNYFLSAATSCGQLPIFMEFILFHFPPSVHCQWESRRAN